MNRRRLDAEAIRDSLLAVAGRLDASHRGDRRSRTWPYRAGRCTFSRCARDRARPTSAGCSTAPIRARSSRQRGESVVAPQALFFLNDPFVSEIARALAARVAHEEPGTPEARIRRLYALRPGPAAGAGRAGPWPAVLGRGRRRSTAWERYCHLILCQNEVSLS